MNQHEMADLLEIQQLAARYMMLSARKDNDCQSGRLTRLSFSIIRPAFSSASRLNTPAAYVPG